jgi:glutamine synthetase
MTVALGREATRIRDERGFAAVADYLDDHHITTVVLGGCDTYGVMRGKRLPVGQVPRVLQHGLPICDVFWVAHVDESELVDRPATHTGYFPSRERGYPDIYAAPDLNTLRLVPWHPNTAFMLCDWQLPHTRTPVPIAPRDVLAAVVERARGLGYEPMSALELEFYLLRETPGTMHRKRADELVPYQERPSTYGVVMGSIQEEIGAAIRNLMLEYQLPIEACNPETGPGQFEITLQYGPSVRSSDEAFMFKSAVKEVAAQHGLLATFMAKPNTSWSGSSCHVHMSLRDAGDRGVFYAADHPQRISDTMRHFAGGMLATMREFTALMAPTPNSYRRYLPYSWAGTTATWGIDNRSTGLRVIQEGDHGTRIEHRQAGGDANPYIATAAALAGGLYGIVNEIEPRELSDLDAYAQPFDGDTALPPSLGEAVDLLADSSIAREWLGSDFVDHYVVIKRAELEAQAVAVTDWEIARYLEAM